MRCHNQSYFLLFQEMMSQSYLHCILTTDLIQTSNQDFSFENHSSLLVGVLFSTEDENEKKDKMR